MEPWQEGCFAKVLEYGFKIKLGGTKRAPVIKGIFEEACKMVGNILFVNFIMDKLVRYVLPPAHQVGRLVG